MAVVIYPRSLGMVLSAINDIIELQNATLSFSDTTNGKINFFITMYGYTWEFYFTVTGLEDKQTRVCLEAKGEELGKDDIVRRELLLLDSMLAAGKREVTREK